MKSLSAENNFGRLSSIGIGVLPTKNNICAITDFCKISTGKILGPIPPLVSL